MSTFFYKISVVTQDNFMHKTYHKLARTFDIYTIRKKYLLKIQKFANLHTSSWIPNLYHWIQSAAIKMMTNTDLEQTFTDYYISQKHRHNSQKRQDAQRLCTCNRRCTGVCHFNSIRSSTMAVKLFIFRNNVFH